MYAAAEVDASDATAGIDEFCRGAVDARGEMREPLAQSSTAYMAFIRERFARLSKGGGEWPDLALSTKIKRMRARFNRDMVRSTGYSEGGGETFAPTGVRGRLLRPYGAKVKALAKSNPALTRGQLLAQVAASTHFDILRDTDLLFNSVTQGAPGHLEQELEDGVRTGTNVPYGRFHQAPTIPGRPPVREILVVPDATTLDRIKDFIVGGILAVRRRIFGS